MSYRGGNSARKLLSSENEIHKTKKESIMKRFHVHVSVDDLDANVRFYSTVFGASPTVLKSDYAKWMIDDPRVNFAISKRGDRKSTRLNSSHLGISYAVFCF